MYKTQIRLFISFLLLFSVANNSFGMIKRLFKRRGRVERGSNFDSRLRLLCFAAFEKGSVNLYDNVSTKRLKEMPVFFSEEGKEELQSLNGFPAVFSPDGSLFAYLRLWKDCEIRISVCNVNLLQLVHEMVIYNGKVSALAFSQDNKMLAVCSLQHNDCVVMIYDIHSCRGRDIGLCRYYHRNLKSLQYCKIGSSNLYATSMSFQGSVLWMAVRQSNADIASEQSTVIAWDVKSNTFPYNKSVRGRVVSRGKIICLNNEKVFLAALGRSGSRIKVIDVKRNRIMKKRIPGYNKDLSLFGFFPNSSYLYHYVYLPDEQASNMHIIDVESGWEGELDLSNCRSLHGQHIVFCLASDLMRESQDLQERVQCFVDAPEYMPDAVQLRAGQSSMRIPRVFLF